MLRAPSGQDRPADVAIKAALRLAPNRCLSKKSLKKSLGVTKESGNAGTFKTTLAELAKSGRILVDDAGRQVTLLKQKKSSKKRTRPVATGDDPEGNPAGSEADNKELAAPASKKAKSIPVEGTNASLSKASSNPTPSEGDGCTRMFLGNLSFKIDRESLKNAIAGITHVKWITDKETQKFYGSAFVEMKDQAAAKAAFAMKGSKILGRELKINYSPARVGDIWPPVNDEQSGDTKVVQGRAPSEKPFEGCNKLFCGNLSYEIEDDHIHDFFKDCGTVQSIRYLTHVGTDEFKGIAYVDFTDPDAADAAILLNGQKMLNRPIRLDWAS